MSKSAALAPTSSRPFIRYAHTPSMVAANGLTGPSSVLPRRSEAASGVRVVTVPTRSQEATTDAGVAGVARTDADTETNAGASTVAAGSTDADADRSGRDTTGAGRPSRTSARGHRRWRRLGAAAMLAATLATGSALPAQAATADAATRVVGTIHQPATLTSPAGLTASSTPLSPRKGRG